MYDKETNKLKDIMPALNHLKEMYEKGIEVIECKILDIMPALLHYMEQFTKYHKQKEEVSEKLDELLEKMGDKRETEDEENE